MEWYRKNTTLFLSVAQQLNDSHTTITHDVARTSVEQTHFEVLHPQSMFCTPSPIHQTFGQIRELVNTTSHEWMTNLFGVNLNTPNFASLKHVDAPYSFGEQGQSSSAAATHTKYTNTEQHHHHKGELVIYERRNL